MKLFIRGCKNLKKGESSTCPRHKKAEKYFYYKNKINRIYHKYKRDFYTYDYLSEDLKTCYADVIILSKKEKLAYYCFFTLAQSEMVTQVEHLMWEIEFNELYEKYELDKDWHWIPHERDSTGKVKTYTVDTPETNKIRPEFGDRDFYGYKKYKETQYLEENKPEVFEEYRIHKNYCNCIKYVDFIVDELYINQEVIEKHIKRFYELGEVSWKSNTPVSQDRLCYSSDWQRIWELPLGIPLDDELYLGKKLEDFMKEKK